MKRPLAALLLALGLTVSLCASATASPKTLKFHHSGLDDPARDPQGTMGRVFKTIVETPGTENLKVTLLAGGVLGPNKDVLRMVREGHIQAALLDADAMLEIFPAMEALELPFVLPDAPTAASVLDGAFGQRLATAMQKATGLKVLGFGDAEGFVQITAPKLDYAASGGLAGQRLGVSLPIQARLVERLGAIPVMLPPAELFAALQDGRIDGVAGTVEDLATAKVGEAQKYLIMADALLSPTVWVMNEAFWDGLTTDEQALVSRAARTALMAGRGVARAVEASDRGIPALRQVMKPVPMAPEVRAALREAALPALRGKLAQPAAAPETPSARSSAAMPAAQTAAPAGTQPAATAEGVELLGAWLQAVLQNAAPWPLPKEQPESPAAAPVPNPAPNPVPAPAAQPAPPAAPETPSPEASPKTEGIR